MRLTNTPRTMRVSPSRSSARRRPLRASEEVGDVTVAPEASELLFEAQDVAEIVAEATGEAVEVTADEDQVTFDVGEDSITVQAEGNEEVLESSTRIRGRRRVAASSSARRGRPVRRTYR